MGAKMRMWGGDLHGTDDPRKHERVSNEAYIPSHYFDIQGLGYIRNNSEAESEGEGVRVRTRSKVQGRELETSWGSVKCRVRDKLG